MTTARPYNALKDVNYVIAEVRKLQEQHGWERLPSSGVLREYDGSLAAAITKYHGGYNQFRTLLGEKQMRIPSEDARSLEYVTERAHEIMEKHGFETLPGGEKLGELGYNSLVTAVSRYHGGMRTFRDQLGQIVTEKPHGYWNSAENVIRETRVALQKHQWETIPDGVTLIKNGYGSMLAAIGKVCGGVVQLRKTLGLPIHHPRRAPRKYTLSDGDWTSAEEVINELQHIQETFGYERLPSSKQLRSLGLKTFADAITKHHKGIGYLRVAAGEDRDRYPRGYWNSLENVLQELARIKEEQGLAQIPSQKQLSGLGYSSLSFAVHQHGGFPKIRRLFGETKVKAVKGTWRDREYTLTRLREIMAEHNFTEIPSQKTLRSLGYNDITIAIERHHGGYQALRKSFGEEQQGNPFGSLRNFDYVCTLLKKIMEEHHLTKVPSTVVLQKLGHSSLGHAIYAHHGGYARMRELFGEAPTTPPNTWKDEDYALQQAVAFLHEHKLTELPPSDHLRRLGWGMLSYAITNYHGGFAHFRDLLRQETKTESPREKLEDVLARYVA